MAQRGGRFANPVCVEQHFGMAKNTIRILVIDAGSCFLCFNSVLSRQVRSFLADFICRKIPNISLLHVSLTVLPAHVPSPAL
jgi:hypothetical protein